MENIYNREDYQSYINFIYGRKQPEPEEEKFYKADMHVHCEYSYDSKMSIESIINHFDEASVSAIPELTANDIDANLIHEAAIGKIAGEQLIKLMTLGLTEKEAEEQIINGFLK